MCAGRGAARLASLLDLERAGVDIREIQSDLIREEQARQHAAWRTFAFPLPPSDNEINRCRGIYLGRDPVTGKHRVRAQLYKTQAWKDYLRVIDAHFAGAPVLWPWPQMLEVKIHWRMPRAGCDGPNRLKALLDALEGHLWEDDEQVAEMARVRRVVDHGNPGVVLEVRRCAVDRYGAPTLL